MVGNNLGGILLKTNVDLSDSIANIYIKYKIKLCYTEIISKYLLLYIVILN